MCRSPGRLSPGSGTEAAERHRFAATAWAQSIGGDRNFDLHYLVSDPTARNWRVPRPTGIAAQTSWVADAGPGTLAVAYTIREGMRPGIYACLGRDDGATWNTADQVFVWDAVGQEFLGVEHKPGYPVSHSDIAFGKPNLVPLSDGDLLCSWWCTQACVTHARWARLRAADST